MNDIINNHLRIVNINTALSLLILVLFITGLGLSISNNIEGSKIVNIIGIIATMVLCGNSYTLYSEHPSIVNQELLDV